MAVMVRARIKYQVLTYRTNDASLQVSKENGITLQHTSHLPNKDGDGVFPGLMQAEVERGTPGPKEKKHGMKDRSNEGDEQDTDLPCR